MGVQINRRVVKMAGRGLRGPRGFNGPDLVELAGPDGAQEIGFGPGATVADLRSSDEGKGAALVPFKNRSAGAKLLDDWIDLADYLPGGFVSDGSVDYAAHIATAFAAAAGRGLRFPADGGTFTSSAPQPMPSATALDLRGCTLNFTVSGATDCLKPTDGCSVFNGSVTVNGSSPSGSGQYHTPIMVGDYAIGTGHSRITLSNLTVNTNRVDGNGIFITGDSHDILIENITVPDSATMGRPILIHWGGGAVPSAGTTHPHDITIRNVTGGDLSFSGLGGAMVFISAAFNITVENISAESCGRSIVCVYAGDHGFKYAPADQAALGCTGIRITNARCAVSAFNGFEINGRRLLEGAESEIMQVSFQGCATQSNKGAGTGNGFIVQYAKAVTIRDCQAFGHLNGVGTVEGVENLLVDGGFYCDNRLNGVALTNAGVPPRNCTVQNATCFGNGEFGTGRNRSGVYIGNGINCAVVNCTLGQASEPHQWYGASSELAGNRARMTGNRVLGVASGGLAYFRAPNTTTFDSTAVFEGNTASSGVPFASGPVELSGSTTTDVASIAAGGSATVTITVTGAAVGDFVVWSASANPGAGLIITARVSAADTVTLTLYNPTGSAIDPANMSYRARVLRWL